MASSTTTGDATAGGDSLPEDMIRLIGWRVLAGDFQDYVRFRAACRWWRSCTDCPRGRGVADRRFHPRGWTMLPEGHGLCPGHSDLGGCIRLFNRFSGVFVRVRLPHFGDHHILDAVDGIFVLMRHGDTVVRLLHPFTGDIADLPPLYTLLPPLPDGYSSPLTTYIRTLDWIDLNGIHTTSISPSANGVTAMMFLQNGFVVFATSGGQQWFESSFKLPCYCRPRSFQGKLYLVGRSADKFDRMAGKFGVHQLDPPQNQDSSSSLQLLPPKFIATLCSPIPGQYFYLAECNSEILLLSRDGVKSKSFLVYRLADLILERMAPVTSIGGYAIFCHHLGGTLSINSRAMPTIMGDTAVFFDKDQYLTQYHLGSGTVSLAADQQPECGLRPVPGPCTILRRGKIIGIWSGWRKER
ncbi:hypothetical protein ACP70R_007352 [Stipagrostis hirtigluma subsp. patula]